MPTNATKSRPNRDQVRSVDGLTTLTAPGTWTARKARTPALLSSNFSRVLVSNACAMIHTSSRARHALLSPLPPSPFLPDLQNKEISLALLRPKQTNPKPKAPTCPVSQAGLLHQRSRQQRPLAAASPPLGYLPSSLPPSPDSSCQALNLEQ